MRLFIASPVMLDNYTQIKGDFEGIFEGKWVEKKNLHLTWLFLGEVSDPEPIMEKINTIPPLESQVAVAGLGYFGRPPRVFFAQAASKALYDKAREFRNTGFDLYRFKPHITLCRIKHISDYGKFKELLQAYREKRLGTIETEIHLYRSRLHTSGAEYTKLL